MTVHQIVSVGRSARVLLAVIVVMIAAPAMAKHVALVSPDGRIALRIEPSSQALRYSVSVDGKEVLAPSRIAIAIDGIGTLGRKPVLVREARRAVNEVITPTVALKASKIEDRYNELTLSFEGGYAVIFRAYDTGVAYRLRLDLPGEVTILDETVEYRFAAAAEAYFPKEDSMFSHNERTYLRKSLDEIPAGDLASLPALVRTGGLSLLLSETALRDYPGLWILGTAGLGFDGTFAKYPLATAMKKDKADRSELVTKTADFIAKTRGSRELPWRFLGIARADGELITNQLAYQLADPVEIEDTSWIKPGKVSWDWWNFNNLYGVDFRAGVNTQTYKYYIDFAAANGLEYVILDEGWYRLGDLLDVIPEIDIPEIVAHARERNVGVILWVVWKTLDLQLDAAMAKFDEWGIAGLKIDFMQRDDQWMVSYYWRMAQAAAGHRLLVDFHGSYKPAGLHRTYPNVMTYEGVKGLEHNKWADSITPTHNLIIPFIRMAAGPLDYTPGAMLNATMSDFRYIMNRPMSMTTRVQQLAMYVVYESPLQMLADSPSNYMREPECTAFIASVPTIWDETRVLAASIGEYLVLARRRGDRWFVGAMTNEEPRELTIDLGFLAAGDHAMVAFEDGINADRVAIDYRRIERAVDAKARISVRLAPGGGWAARIERAPAAR